MWTVGEQKLWPRATDVDNIIANQDRYNFSFPTYVPLFPWLVSLF